LVKVSADHQPVPPAAIPSMPFQPIGLDELTITPYVDDNGTGHARRFPSERWVSNWLPNRP